MPISDTQLKQSFNLQLANYRQSIDDRIADYAQQKSTVVSAAFGPQSAQALDAFLQILGRGGKRIRGALTMASYQMFGGKNNEVALHAALIMEMIQAYLLIIDDVCDRSQLRRGGPSAHTLMANLHKQQSWQDDSQHFGESIATLAAVLGLHEAMVEIDELGVKDQVKLAAMRNLNHCLSITAHGQFNDIFAQVMQQTDTQPIENILIWKTAYYTFVNPLQFGALLAGANEVAVQSVMDFSIHAGRAFQLSDDLLGTFSTTQEAGKSTLDDIKEGKRTLQVVIALKQASKADQDYLNSMLGNQSLTLQQLSNCQEIIKTSGAYDHVVQETARSLATARQSLTQIAPHASPEGLTFLSGMLDYLESRSS